MVSGFEFLLPHSFYDGLRYGGKTAHAERSFEAILKFVRTTKGFYGRPAKGMTSRVDTKRSEKNSLHLSNFGQNVAKISQFLKHNCITRRT